MSAPFRVLSKGRVRVARTGDEEFKSYLDRLTKMIPSEVISLYLVGSGIIPDSDRIILVLWSLICLAGVIVSRIFGTADPQKNLTPQWTTVGISSVAFIIWIYSLGGPFAAFHLHTPYIGSLLVLVWTFFVPFFYKGSYE